MAHDCKLGCRVGIEPLLQIGCYMVEIWRASTVVGYIFCSSGHMTWTFWSGYEMVRVRPTVVEFIFCSFLVQIKYIPSAPSIEQFWGTATRSDISSASSCIQLRPEMVVKDASVPMKWLLAIGFCLATILAFVEAVMSRDRRRRKLRLKL